MRNHQPRKVSVNKIKSGDHAHLGESRTPHHVHEAPLVHHPPTSAILVVCPLKLHERLLLEPRTLKDGGSHDAQAFGDLKKPFESQHRIAEL